MLILLLGMGEFTVSQWLSTKIAYFPGAFDRSETVPHKTLTPHSFLFNFFFCGFHFFGRVRGGWQGGCIVTWRGSKGTPIVLGKKLLFGLVVLSKKKEDIIYISSQ